ncbi:molecular chaperone DjlA [Erwinia sp. OLTSP20]|uniref:co-chaperone DjlA n=1 Tax=unclassified Erwinia TaxID=2622719 RepID=UPI000C190F14|nr:MULTISPECIES: co-chaperone DjlA [unclassified Erwinia]PIJ49727.1 molecular chaperone DjlA [Erwinia sp. OAMSP11]PIJ70825.1 molecular chaperone DjlA [Erwinia sp. OLSSP12]PIJ80191.1 molecular chaperone DjlA [Erwinia sp. OLCASP19]PIJ82314.1 molecular chaperone DjlA [Erwinia sp. OLMTSP26]PIJ85001.1 molecular chaperone DjlA [Erwinia sp. OLMDSP33]
MRYWGKVIGLVLGSLSGGGFWAVVVGIAIGHFIDKALSGPRQGYFSSNQTRQSLFFRTTFQVMGHLTKAKGRVTDVDIQMATLQMDRMQLHGEARTAAQQAFREGKQSDFPLREKLRELKSVCFGRFDLIRMFLEIQIQAAFADGQLHPNERQVLFVIAEELGISRLQFEQFLRMMTSGQHFGAGGQQQGHQGRYQQSSQGPTLQDACSVLGVKPDDDNTTVKRAYRKLMSEHHPDKLVAKGLPPQMMEMAKQKAQKIQAAYDLIRRERGLK